MITLKKSLKLPFYFINGEVDDTTARALDSELSYYVEDYERTKRYQDGRWDGRERLLKRTRKGDYYFPVGLLDRAVAVLQSLEVEYEIEEEYTAHEKISVHKPPVKLRDYQQEAMIKAISHGSGVICLPTGAGKTLVGIYLIYAFSCRTLICVHTKELFAQWKSEIENRLRYFPGMVGDAREEWKDITIAMIQTAHKLDIPEFDMLIFDECHRIPSNTAYRLAMKSNASYRFGASATPRREDGADMKIWAATGPIIVNVTAEDLVERGYLAKPRFVFLNPPHKRLANYDWQKEYREGIVKNAERNDMIKEQALKLVREGRQVYIHVARIDHGKKLSNLIGCPFLSGKDASKKRQDLLDKFKNGEINCIVSTLLGEGVDIPSMSGIILAHGQKTSVGTIQKIGRVLRPLPGKEDAVIVDFMDKGVHLARHWENRYWAYEQAYGSYLR